MKETEKILLRRKHNLIVKPGNTDHEQDATEKALVVSMLKNVQSLGFTFSHDLMNKLFCMTKRELRDFYSALVPELKALVGADVEYRPMYPNFPEQVAEADDVELFINAIIHYWSFGNLMPEYEKTERLPLIDSNKMTVLSVGKHKDLMEIFTNLCSSKTSISGQDKEDVKTIVTECSDYANYLPDEIPLKENAALIGKLILENAAVKTSKSIQKYFKTATDVLRLVTALSDGDLSLASKTKYRSLKRAERRMILDLLSECGNITEDLFRYQYEWIRVAEILHPFEYTAKRYSEVNKAFNTLRNEHKPLMFGGVVQSAIDAGNIRWATNVLKSRPGEFARQLDKLLRDADDIGTQDYIVNSFQQVAENVSSPVLLQVGQHFWGRSKKDSSPIRVFFPKGNLAKAKVIQNNLPHINSVICQKLSEVCDSALVKQYEKKEPLGNVYVDEEFSNYLVPFSQRSASKAVKTIVRGSALPIKKNAKAVRSFIWWTNTGNKTSNSRWADTSRVDIDLSAAIYDENWRYVSHVSYTNLRSAKYRAYHSGDITNGGRADGKGVAEFLDVDIDAVANNAGRYIVFQVYSFTRQKFSDLPNCRFGWMEREDVHSGEIFEPSTVEMKMDLTSESTTAIPVIFDCVERKFIWCDMNLGISSFGMGGNNLESNLSGVTATCYAMTHLNKPNLYDLVTLNAIARGKIVHDRNQADIIFSNDTTVPYEVVSERDETTGIEKPVLREKPDVPIITAFDTDYFVGQLL